MRFNSVYITLALAHFAIAAPAGIPPREPPSIQDTPGSNVPAMVGGQSGYKSISNSAQVDPNNNPQARPQWKKGKRNESISPEHW